MSKILKRTLSAIISLALAATCLIATSAPTAIVSADETNLAVTATATADSVNTQWGGDIANINDGDYDTRWQSNNAGSSIETMSWVQLDFGVATTFDKVTVNFENARATANGTAIKVSNNGTDWSDVTATASEEVNVKNPAGGDMWVTEFTFDAQTARYLKLEFTEAKENGKGGFWEYTSIWEVEVFNINGGTDTPPVEPSGDFGINGAQVRENVEESAKYDLRFITNFSDDLYASIADITDLGVILVRADQLTAAGLTAEDINLELAAENLVVKKVQATYLRNIDLATTGNYTYTVTILGIEDISIEYVCVAYYTTAEGTVYTEALTKSVADGL